MSDLSSGSNDVGLANRRRARREQVLAACEECRSKKTKCDSERPCGRCQARGIDCKWEAEPDERRTVARKRRFEAAQNENQVYRELYEAIQSMPDTEIAAIVDRVRRQHSASEVLQFARQQRLFIQRQLPRPSGDSAMKAIDAHILRQASIKVPARPWTSVADDGMVSHLISLFFELEQVIHEPYVVREPFLREMVAADVKNARWCSPLLVNVICAMSCFLSNYSTIHLKLDEGLLRERFINEARRLLENEAGKRSLPAAQALALMHLYYCGAAKDGGGAIYRFAAAEMYKGLRLGEVMPQNTGDESEERIQENPFPSCMGNVLSRETQSGNPPHQTIGSVLNAQCSLMEIFYAISMLRAAGSPEDARERVKLYDDLVKWYQQLPPKAQYEPHMIRHYHAMRMLFHFGTILLFRPLRTINGSSCKPLQDPTERCLSSCESMLAELDDWEKIYPRDFDPSMCTTIFAHYVMAFTLLPMLATEVRSRPLVLRSCKFFYNTARHWPATGIMLQGIDASFRLGGIALPNECLRFLPSYQSSKADGGDACHQLGHSTPDRRQLDFGRDEYRAWKPHLPIFRIVSCEQWIRSLKDLRVQSTLV